ncbi:hypothetical protein [Actinomadura flavalba]|nr:hypothetical protein [Actinomadura flavalba]
MDKSRDPSPQPAPRVPRWLIGVDLAALAKASVTYGLGTTAGRCTD